MSTSVERVFSESAEFQSELDRFDDFLQKNAWEVRLVAADTTRASSRRQIVWDIDIPTPHYKEGMFNAVPFWIANTHPTGIEIGRAFCDLEPANVLNPNARGQVALHKEIPAKQIADLIIAKGMASTWVTTGINPLRETSDITKLREIDKRVRSESNHHMNKVVIDASNGHSKDTERRVNKIREVFGDQIIILSGNVTKGDTTQRLIEAGADGVKLNHGPAKVCETETNAGTFSPTFRNALECSQAARELGGFTVSDAGGISKPGTAAVLFGLGVHGVMSGSFAAGRKESNVEYRRNWFGRTKGIPWLSLYHEYHGSASSWARQTYNGENTSTRPSEGTTRLIALKKGSLEREFSQYCASISSAMSFQSEVDPCAHRLLEHVPADVLVPDIHTDTIDLTDTWRWDQLVVAREQHSRQSPRFCYRRSL